MAQKTNDAYDSYRSSVGNDTDKPASILGKRTHEQRMDQHPPEPIDTYVKTMSTDDKKHVRDLLLDYLVSLVAEKICIGDMDFCNPSLTPTIHLSPAFKGQLTQRKKALDTLFQKVVDQTVDVKDAPPPALYTPISTSAMFNSSDNAYVKTFKEIKDKYVEAIKGMF
jgi:hypothetical protein